MDVRQISRELGVQYILEGSIRKAGSRVRIAGQLVDGTTGHHVWADHFDGDMNDIFELQDRVTESVVGAVEPSIRLEEIRQSHRRPTQYVGAYDLYLRALPCFYGMTREGFADVRKLTNEALSIDPDFTLARALGAYIRSISVSQSWHEPDDARVAVRMATEVLSKARDDPTSLRFAAQVLSYSAKDYETALGAIERSLYLNPSSAQGYTGSGWVNTYAGYPLVAIDHFNRALRLSPVDPEKGIALSGIGMSHLMLDQFDQALEAGERALREMPNYATSYRVVISALVGLGRLDEAREAANRLMRAFPRYSLGLQLRSTHGGTSGSDSAISRRCGQRAFPSRRQSARWKTPAMTAPVRIRLYPTAPFLISQTAWECRPWLLCRWVSKVAHTVRMKGRPASGTAIRIPLLVAMPSAERRSIVSNSGAKSDGSTLCARHNSPTSTLRSHISLSMISPRRRSWSSKAMPLSVAKRPSRIAAR